MCTVCSRYGQHVKTFANYDSRDLHRLSKEDIVQVAIYEADAGVLLFVSCWNPLLRSRIILYESGQNDVTVK
jgi:hypothetical protein